MSQPKYAILIQWSEFDQSYIAVVPEFRNKKCVAYGTTYEECFFNGMEAMKKAVSGDFDCNAATRESLQDLHKMTLPDPYLYGKWRLVNNRYLKSTLYNAHSMLDMETESSWLEH